MKRMIITVIMTCGFLYASDDSLRLPLYYDPMTNSIAELPVDLHQIDPFTQCDFQTLIKRAFEKEGHRYGITVFMCMNISGQMEYGVADTIAFRQWIAASGKTVPITNKPIAYNSIQDYLIEPAAPNLSYHYEVFKLPAAHYPSSGEKRKREIEVEDDTLERIFKKLQADKELRRAKELAFLREND